MTTNKITLLFGRICSGKSTMYPDAKRIVVSNIVKGILETTDRDKLQDSMHLDLEIARSICMNLYHYAEQYPHVVVDGIRQSTIVDFILAEFPDVEMIWLEVPVEERKRRYESRKDKKDVQPFEIADNKHIELECQNIFTIFKQRLKVIDNYEATKKS
jgi:hypothetical protein